MPRWIIAACAGFSYATLLIPAAGSWLTDWQQANQIHDYQAVVASANQEVINDQLIQAEAYNRRLAAGSQVVLPNEEADREYFELLAVPGKSIIGQVAITRLGIELPIYHGTSEEALSTGAGHLYGTSLPVGGRGTHTVLTAHSGMSTGTGFDALHQARIGDVITIQVLDRSLAYRVREITVVEPTDTSVLDIQDETDLITLITCTPIGINSHRLLITGERMPTVPAAPQLISTRRNIDPPWWLAIWSFATAATSWVIGILVPPITPPNQKGKHVSQNQIPRGHPRRGIVRPDRGREIRTEPQPADIGGYHGDRHAVGPPVYRKPGKQPRGQGPRPHTPAWYPVRG